jgi:hypothetical protein
VESFYAILKISILSDNGLKISREIKAMGTRSLHLIVSSILLIVILAACGSPSTVVPTSTPIKVVGPAATLPVTSTLPVIPTAAPTQAGSGGCTNTYFPLSSGATWSYASTGSLVGDYAYTRTLSGLSDMGFTTSDAFSGVTRTVTWSCDSGNLTSLATGSSGTLVSGSSMTMTVDSVNATGYVIPDAFTDGKTWSEDLSINGTNVQGTTKKGTVVSEVKTDCMTAGAESVKVPAGTFDTVKITCHSDQVATVTLTVGGTTGPITTIQNSTQWYAQGVGMVQTVNSGDAGIETIQLTSYSIP